MIHALKTIQDLLLTSSDDYADIADSINEDPLKTLFVVECETIDKLLIEHYTAVDDLDIFFQRMREAIF